MAIEAALVKPVVDALMALFRRGENMHLKHDAEAALREAIRELLLANPDENKAQAKIAIAKAAGILSEDGCWPRTCWKRPARRRRKPQASPRPGASANPRRPRPKRSRRRKRNRPRRKPRRSAAERTHDPARHAVPRPEHDLGRERNLDRRKARPMAAKPTTAAAYGCCTSRSGARSSPRCGCRGKGFGRLDDGLIVPLFRIGCGLMIAGMLFRWWAVRVLDRASSSMSRSATTTSPSATAHIACCGIRYTDRWRRSTASHSRSAAPGRSP